MAQTEYVVWYTRYWCEDFRGTESECWAWIKRHVGCSVYESERYGYEILDAETREAQVYDC